MRVGLVVVIRDEGMGKGTSRRVITPTAINRWSLGTDLGVWSSVLMLRIAFNFWERTDGGALIARM